jgi:diadenylate cyclase
MIDDKLNNNLMEIFKLVSPGAPLRIAIDDVAKSGTGALIVFGDSPEMMRIINGGFEVNCKFTPQRLVELCKMDGAVVVDSDVKKILYANTLLVPDPSIPTFETGTRHKAAERTSKQINQLVIAISEKKKVISLYYGDTKYVIREAKEILDRSSETLRMLEKHKEIFTELLLNMNVLEFTGLVSVQDVLMLIQRAEIIDRMAAIIKRYMIELGTEGGLVRLQLKELIKGVGEEELAIIQDYSKRDMISIKNSLLALSMEEIIEHDKIILALGFQTHDESIVTRGYRILKRTSLIEQEIESLIKKFGNLQSILDAKEENLEQIVGKDKSKKLKKELQHLKEQVMLGKKI